MKIVVATALVIGLAACRSAGTPAAPSPTELGCEIVVTQTADGRAGAAGCAPSVTPRVAGTQQPPKEQKGKGKGGG